MKFRFKNFKVYQDSKRFCKSGLDIVENEIKGKDKDLASQIRRALNSIILNIAESSADNSDVEFARFFGISIRSAYEVVAGFDLALLYGMIVEEQNEKIESDAQELVKQLSAFRNSLKPN
jgi:four helix bundle protein